MPATAAATCRACARGDHAGCWESDPPDHAPWLLCPCEHTRPRFIVRPLMTYGLAGWTVWDRKKGEACGWFGSSVRMAAERMAVLANTDTLTRPRS